VACMGIKFNYFISKQGCLDPTFESIFRKEKR